MGSAEGERLVDELASRPPTLGGARLLAIDGPAGSGKTTLASAVCGRLAEAGTRVALMSLDDMYDGWGGLNPALSARLVNQVLAPLARGRTARWQAYDWAAQGFGAWHDLAPPEVLVLEGCGSGARVQAPYTTLLVWLETARETGTARMVARDGPAVLDHLVAWRRSEEVHFVANQTRQRADIVIAT